MGWLRRCAGLWLERLSGPSARLSTLCVGLIVVVGCFTLVVAPDDFPREHADRLPTVVIDAGHGGNDDGAKAAGVVEKQATLELALRLEAILHQRGFATRLTRREDRYVALSQRVAAANGLKETPLFVSVHFNKTGGKGINGIETFYAASKKLLPVQPKGWRWIGFFNPPEPPDLGESLAAEVQAAVIARTGAKNRGIRPRNLYVTAHTRGCAILVEGGFVSNTKEGYLLGSPLYMDRLAEGIADGIGSWCRCAPRARLAH